MNETSRIWDYVVVGAGSSGCAVTGHLAALGLQVLVVEAGPSDRSPLIKIPTALFWKDDRVKKYDWGYKTLADPTRSGMAEPWMRGKVVGGSSSINGMLYVRGCPGDYDRWESMGNCGWGSESVNAVFRSLERTGFNSAARGQNGPLHIRSVESRHRITDAFLNAAVLCGFPYNADYNDGLQEGVGPAQLTQCGHFRWSSADAFLRPALKKGNVQLLTEAFVQKLILRNGSVIGTRIEHKYGVHDVRSRRVILCAGSINTPKILMLSGIGNADELSAVGIPVVLHVPGVGNNLQDHPLVNVTFDTNIETNTPTAKMLQRLSFVLRYLMKCEGPIATSFEAVAFLRTAKRLSRPDIQLHFMPLGITRLSDRGHDPIRCLQPSVTVYVNKNNPKSRGKITLTSGDPHASPAIQCRLLASEEDTETLASGVEVVRRIMRTAPMSQFLIRERWPGVRINCREDLREYVRLNAETAYHPVGTCRMGIDDYAVVTPELQVKGVDNLWVADASVMPDLVSGNTNAACLMIGAKLGQILGKKSKRLNIIS